MWHRRHVVVTSSSCRRHLPNVWSKKFGKKLPGKANQIFKKLQIENECLRYPQQLHAFNMIQDMPIISQSQDVPFHSTWRAWHLWHLKHCNPKFAMKHWNLGSLELETWKLGSQIGRGTWLELGRVELGRPLERVGTCTIVWNWKHSVGSNLSIPLGKNKQTEQEQTTQDDEEKEEKLQRQTKFCIFEPVPRSSHLGPLSMNLQDSWPSSYKIDTLQNQHFFQFYTCPIPIEISLHHFPTPTDPLTNPN